MAKAKPIDVELVRSLLEYAPELGGSCLRWKVDRLGNNGGVKIKAGATAGYKHHTGYWYVGINGKAYSVHRLVWAIVKGEDPQCQVDHIHGTEAGNHIENLRLAVRGQFDNTQNTRMYKNNTSGYPGVSFKKQMGKWVGSIRVNNVKKHIGYFDTPEEAHEAYLKAKAELHAFQPTPRGTI